jgi:N-formylglutamate amidohydrolase
MGCRLPKGKPPPAGAPGERRTGDKAALFRYIRKAMTSDDCGRSGPEKPSPISPRGPRERASPWEILAPDPQRAPLVFASPHSGTAYSAAFLAATSLDLLTIRRSEDSFVDELFAAAPALGAPLLRAHFPRAYVDVNREPFELDPDMFEDELPSYANTQSSRVAAGLGTIARVVSSGQEIYRGKLRFADAAERINGYYRPYHRALQALIDDTKARFGWCALIDCHSMPSVGGPLDPDAGRGRADFVLGDCFGSACGAVITRTVEETLRGMGYAVVRNKPFAGGYTTRHYGRPASGVHTLQIEINRALYMDERRIARSDRFPAVAQEMTRVIAALCRAGAVDLAAE